MKKHISFLTITIMLLSCSQSSQTEKELRAVLNTPLNFGELDTVQHMGSLLSLQHLSESYDYKFVVFLQEGCSPCYPRFIEWHQKMDSFKLVDNYTVLFVIQNGDYSDFMSKVLDLGYVDDIYYTMMDVNYSFLELNTHIPRWIIHSSVLIDSQNRIKMVGAHWVNEDMKNLFYKTVSNEQ